jgi:hypothetical protein
MALGDARPPQLAASIAQEGMALAFSQRSHHDASRLQSRPVFGGTCRGNDCRNVSFVGIWLGLFRTLMALCLFSIAWHKLRPMKKPRVINRTAPETHSLTADTH